jgi:hypothetical protein
MLEAERRRTPQANGRRQERRGTERSPALGGGLTLVIQDGQDAYQRVFADVGHGTRGSQRLSLADAEEPGEIFLQKAVGGARLAELFSSKLMGCRVVR